MNSWLYGLYALILGLVSIVTGEIITFVMLGLILMSLQNIHSTLKQILMAQKEQN
ncbi:hypothetical protein [Lentibacillus jeotgali]|uniref:hypothetical protein n=1 Tax=Lentibacillus jeotgali TaxID=558169 RepID=UPI0002628C1A|nr:hypothetical protein [Lentibacillus jeotgali]